MPTTSTKVPIAVDGPDHTYRLDDQVGFLLRRAYQRARANLVEAIGTLDLTAPQFATLARLHERGKVPQNRLGRLVAMEPANIRDVVLRLKRRRLVTTERDAADARLTLVSLTPAGRAVIGELLRLETKCTSKTLAPLEAHERSVLCDLLRRLADG
jgi:MarR family transcriptional regulator, lower aerobic nicotinate degradation pathway regulator